MQGSRSWGGRPAGRGGGIAGPRGACWGLLATSRLPLAAPGRPEGGGRERRRQEPKWTDRLGVPRRCRCLDGDGGSRTETLESCFGGQRPQALFLDGLCGQKQSESWRRTPGLLACAAGASGAEMGQTGVGTVLRAPWWPRSLTGSSRAGGSQLHPWVLGFLETGWDSGQCWMPCGSAKPGPHALALLLLPSQDAAAGGRSQQPPRGWVRPS